MTPVAAVADDLRTGTATEETNEYLRAIINVRGVGGRQVIRPTTVHVRRRRFFRGERDVGLITV